MNYDEANPGQIFDHLWATKYAPEIEAVARRETERRTDAFADGVTLTVCGEEIRLMTPRDLLLLDGFENAFVCARVPEEKDIVQFLWDLNATNDGTRSWRNRWRKGRCAGRLAVRDDFDADVSEIYGYLSRLWLDEPAGDAAAMEGQPREMRRPPTTYCLAPLMVNVAGTLGATDPMSGLLLADTPIPRLLQYQRAALERKTGEEDATSFDSFRSRCMEEVNQITAERRSRGK